jgi:myo-inositol-1(or 4)-monophosphatase
MTGSLEIELLEIACQLARQAGALVLDGRRQGLVSADTKSTSTDLVTEYDKASERLIVGELSRLRPHDGIIGEEGSSITGNSGVNWLIDPIDGTTNYFYGLTGYAVSIAAASSEGALAGAVYIPVTGELFSAAKGHGATLNGEPLHCSSTTDLAHALVGTGFSYQPAKRVRHAQRIVEMIGEIRDIRRFGAAAPDLCYVAAGRLDAYFEEGLGPWDLAAGELIAREAGCLSGDLAGDRVRPEQVLVANPHLFEPLRELINRADAAIAASS